MTHVYKQFKKYGKAITILRYFWKTNLHNIQKMFLGHP